MKTLHLMLITLFFIFFSGCVSTQVILLEGSKQSSAVVVKTQAGEQVINVPRGQTEISSSKEKPSAPKVLTQDDVQKRFGALIAKAPKPPVSFLLYFKSGGTVLTEESEQLLTLIKHSIKERKPCDVNIIGHADRAGSAHYNITLSLNRAKSVHTWFSKQNLDIRAITVESYGEEDPIVPTKDGVSEPKNRRVEILVR